MQPKFTSLIAISFMTASVYAQNVGIGTISPKARLHVADSAVLFTGPVTLPSVTNYPPPASGPGTRMMWYPQKAAFRVGNVDNNFWDKDSIGRLSFAIGLNTKAIGLISVSMGNGSVATGAVATSMGYNTIAGADAATSMGYITNASGYAATSMGYNTIAEGFYSTSMGIGTNAVGGGATSMGGYTTASGNAATSMGYYTNASGGGATSMGGYTNASGLDATSMGYYTKAKSNYSLVAGSYNDTTAGIDERLFEIGNGTTDNTRHNAFTVLTNGNIGIGTAAPTGPLAFNNVVGNKIVLYGEGAAAHYGIGIQGNVLQLYADAPSSNILFGNGSSTAFTERMRIINSGADGMTLNGRMVLKNGTTDPNNSPGIWFSAPDNTSQVSFLGTQASKTVGFYGGPQGWGFVYDAANSRVGIGTTTPSQALQVAGNILASGTITPSDARYKKNIVLIAAPLEKISQLKGVTYNYRSADFPDMKFSDQQQVGLIAQDVEKVFPQLVFADDKGYKAVDYVKLIPLLVESIKTQQQQIDRQQKIQQQQQQEMDALKQEIKTLLNNK